MSVVSRRYWLSASVLVAAGVPVLTACDKSGGGGATPSPADGSPSQDSAAVAPSATTPSAGVVRLEGVGSIGKPLTVEVGPAVRSGERTVVRLVFETEEKLPVHPILGHPYSLEDVYLLSLEQGLMWPEQDTQEFTKLFGAGASKGKPVEVFPVYGPLGAGVESVQVLLPNFGVALGVAVVDEAQAGFDVQEVLSKAQLDASAAGPLPIEFFSGAADGSFDVGREEDKVTVALASDVTFEFDSADLSAQADTVLGAAVDELALYPSGGTLSIEGHTDDQADEAYNQTLSEERAQAVADRLGQLTDLAKWQVSVVGKGESEPRVKGTTEEARAANRRVEVVATPAKPEEADEARKRALLKGQMPAPEGPVGPGPQGVEAPVVGLDGEKWSVRLDQVTRVGSFLVGNVKATGDSGLLQNRLRLPRPFIFRWGMGATDRQECADSLTLLNGGVRYLAADFKLPSGYRPLSTEFINPVFQPVTLSLPVVWPDLGQDTVTVDLPGASKEMTLRGLICRLTDVPVVQG